ncbi:hypothetical protein [Nocardia pneumoniae]|uniref:hypothetical protein n=1 Tax=Nocardia pneumoniae TaxID=228601 RepID=UPI0012F6843C|nr:hypothetical protein [Nocardia pneumoniae]
MKVTKAPVEERTGGVAAATDSSISAVIGAWIGPGTKPSTDAAPSTVTRRAGSQ